MITMGEGRWLNRSYDGEVRLEMVKENEENVLVSSAKNINRGVPRSNTERHAKVVAGLEKQLKV